MPQVRVLCIGINYVTAPQNQRLYGCVNDVFNMLTFLREVYPTELASAEIRTLTDQDILGHPITDSKKLPTTTNILDSMRWLAAGATSESRLFFHYSGHGSQIRDTSGDEQDGRDEVICPLDYSSGGKVIVDDLIKEIMVTPLPTGAKLTAVFDCCHSGTVLDLKYSYTISKSRRKLLDLSASYTVSTDDHYRPTKAQVTLLSGCRDNESGADTWENRQAQGAMSYCLIEVCHRLAKQKKIVTYEAILGKLMRFIAKRGYKQRPQLSTGTLINLRERFRVF